MYWFISSTLGVTRDRLIGETWIEVKPPAAGIRIAQVSVGTNAVWCVTSDNHVWFRRGVKGALAGFSEDAALGSGWVEMVGNMSNVAVAPNDQVFAVGSENSRSVYFRSGVCDSDLTGKKWRQIQCPMQLSRTCSLASVNSRGSSTGVAGGAGSLNSLRAQSGGVSERARIEEVQIVEEHSRSAPTHNLKHRPELWKKPSPELGACSLGAQNNQQRLDESEEGEDEQAAAQGEQMMAFSAPIPEIHEVRPRQSRHSYMRSAGSVLGMEAMPDAESAVFHSDSSRDSGVFGAEDDDALMMAGAAAGSFWQEQLDMVWAMCAAGAVQVDVNSGLPNWFNDSAALQSAAGQEDLTQPWRLKIIEDLALQANSVNGMPEREKYELAVDTSSWVKTGEARMAKMNGQFEECLIELEWVSSSGGGASESGSGMDSGTLTMLNPDGVTTKMQFPLSEITAVQCCSEVGAPPRLAIHAPRLGGNSAMIKLQFPGDTDMEDWLSHLTSVCCQINSVSGRPSFSAMWATTNLGDVFVFDPENLRVQQEVNEEEGRPAAKYVQEYDLNTTETPYLVYLNNG